MKQRRSLMILLAAVALALLVWLGTFVMVQQHKTLDQRVQEVASQLKCPVCQGESVADSTAAIAEQMRGVIREQLQAGKSEQEVIQYFQSRYGDQITWTPQWRGLELLTWIVPIALVISGVVLLYFILKSWSTVAVQTANSRISIKDQDDEQELAGMDEVELEHYRVQLERELAAEDALFSSYNQTEAK